ncbi:glycosyltransferase [Cetobacterium sp. SF1]|uniref:glycosyltransferase n=1 Tax=Cetobacterium sp. SF1 TaxID=3417654 RepID=UPI003CEA4F1D
MKILQINCVYKVGSTGKIVYDLHTELLKEKMTSYICYGRGKIYKENNVFKITSEIEAKLNALQARITGIQYEGSYFGTNILLQIIEEKKPDIIHLHCLNGFFVNIHRLLEFLKKKKQNTLITLHAEFFYTGNCGHAFECNQWKEGCIKCNSKKKSTYSNLYDSTRRNWLKMYKSFEDFDNLKIIAVSPWLKKRAQEAKIFENRKIDIIENGIDTEKIFYFRKNSNFFKDKSYKYLLHITPNFENEVKGGEHILELSKLNKDKQIKIIIVGKSIRKIFPENIIYLGEIFDQNILAEIYSAVDLTLIVSKRETYSMPVAESLACGTPVIGFECGAPEEIAIKEYSEFIKYGNIEKLNEVIQNWLKITVDKQRLSSQACKRYSKYEMVKKYLNTYRSFI